MGKYQSGDFDDDTLISRVGPWKNKKELNLVYDWLFSAGSTVATKRLALARMKVWKIRRLTLTPATILSTIAILEVQLKDDTTNACSEDLLRTMYSNAFTRFLNYVSSIMRSRTLQSMYSTARELGIESFLVDLRHLCAHGQVLPSLDTSRRTAAYCLHWLREFYWDRERDFITDAEVHDVHLKSSQALEQSIQEWFALYDAATEAIVSGCKNVGDLESGERSTKLTSAEIELLKEFSERDRHNKLLFIANKAINKLAELSNSNERDRGNSFIYCDVLFGCQHFMKRSATYCKSTNKDDQMKFIGIHQNLFRLFAICDFINAVFMRLLLICEDEIEEEYRKKAASFWANEIATGFLVFKEFKNIYKMKKEKNAKFDIDMAPINTDIMTDDIKQIYKQLGVNYRGTLIFGDTVRRPWSLNFDQDFVIERAANINQYTCNIIEKCTQLMEPALKPSEAKDIKRLIAIYMGSSLPETNSENYETHTLDDIEQPPSKRIKLLRNDNNSEKHQIWRPAPDGLNWKTCPIGSLPY